ncbi:MAG TPA: AmmeMemoRadiSam system radical SAM enzyme [Kiritimatiellia bacterium]|nr:AmmeMemoRadiSam system radical SAM enzyme [Kiritimatiellia bacterium]
MKKLLSSLFGIAVVGAAAWWLFARGTPARPAPPAAGADAAAGLHEALWYEALPNGLVHCRLCPNSCRLPEGQIGRCKVRKNIGGKLYTLSYGQLAAVHVDPIEKKPFYHVLPGAQAFSLATPGCNMRCLFCQNWEISQSFPWQVATQAATPEEVVAAALRSGARAIAFTYSEPTIFYEYMLDIARLAKAKGLKTLVVSNGYIQPEPLRELLPFIDAYKVDFKAFNPRFYVDLTGGRRDPVLETMRIIHASGTWLEIVTLLVPGHNDGDDEIRQLARWVMDNLGPDVPLHFSRFHPQHKLANLPPTPVETVIRAREIALAEGLHYVYTGNIPFPEGDSTRSPTTGEIVVERKGYFVVRNALVDGVAPDGTPIPGLWK